MTGTKFEFPESVEKELAAQLAKTPDVRNNEASNSTTTSSAKQIAEQISSSSGVEVETAKPTKAEIEARNRAIEQISSKLYTPKSPLTPEYRSRSVEIEERLQRIQKRFEALKIKEEARSAQLQREAWLRYSHLAKPTIADFKRPLTSFFMLASAAYLSMQYAWYAMERENYVERKELEQEQMVSQLNQAFFTQQTVLEEYQHPQKTRKWYSLW